MSSVRQLERAHRGWDRSFGAVFAKYGDAVGMHGDRWQYMGTTEEQGHVFRHRDIYGDGITRVYENVSVCPTDYEEVGTEPPAT